MLESNITPTDGTHFKNHASSRILLAFPPSFIICLFVSVIAEIVILALESYLTFHRLSFMLPCTVLVLHAFLNCNSSWLSHVSFVVDPYLTRSTRLLCSCLALFAVDPRPALSSLIHYLTPFSFFLTRSTFIAHSYTSLTYGSFPRNNLQITGILTNTITHSHLNHK